MANNIIVKDYANTNTLFKTVDTGSGMLTQFLPSDATGNPFSPSNPVPVAAGQATMVVKAASVNTTSATVLSANTSRRYLSIRNVGSIDVSINFGGNPAVVGITFPIYSGEAIAFEYVCTQQSITAVTPSGSSTLVFIEGIV